VKAAGLVAVQNAEKKYVIFKNFLFGFNGYSKGFMLAISVSAFR